MKAEIIAVGTEILTGQIVNTNTQFLSEKFAELGIDVYFQTAVGDNEERLLSILGIASKRSDLVVLCGGLGPTADDLTKQTLAKFLEKELVFDNQAMEKLDQFFVSRSGRLRTPNNDRQAQLVEGSIPLQNPTGLAVGGIIEQEGVRYILLPGPPSELKPMFTQSLQPILAEKGSQLYSRVLRFFGIGESQLVTVLEDMIENQTDPTLAPYAKIGEVTLRISTKASSFEEATVKLDAYEAEILSQDKLTDYLYGYGEENSLAKVIVAELASAGQTLAVAENLTAGLLQYQLASVETDTTVFEGGRVLSVALYGKDAAQSHADLIRQQTGASLGLALFGEFLPSAQENLQRVRLSLAISSEKGSQAQSVDIGGYALPQLREIACLHALDYMRKSF
ncbi:nicotinamide-nucleotide amidase [Streptococcus gallinaceus]|uniref:competence/damage-inducible protein A n=1 Tax=Streptococcus gallinaceus TaxID=165758 RepID=UPI00209E67C7|nr:competence/damage-inducible protein A [Streptococcus gallinaceus]MCP1639504.1 nicotinamide-nucleotide amidase [Streptococcus gallinaceus]MCP1770287.1 nicotinamide-nucleotide amidase [Streptococcus gallinaceus]